MLELIIFGIIVGCVFMFFVFAGVCYLIKTMSANLFLVKFNNLLDKNEFIDKKTTHGLRKKYAFTYKLFNLFHNDIIDEFMLTYQNLEKEIDKHNEKFVKEEKVEKKEEEKVSEEILLLREINNSLKKQNKNAKKVKNS